MAGVLSSPPDDEQSLDVAVLTTTAVSTTAVTAPEMTTAAPTPTTTIVVSQAGQTRLYRLRLDARHLYNEDPVFWNTNDDGDTVCAAAMEASSPAQWSLILDYVFEHLDGEEEFGFMAEATVSVHCPEAPLYAEGWYVDPVIMPARDEFPPLTTGTPADRYKEYMSRLYYDESPWPDNSLNSTRSLYCGPAVSAQSEHEFGVGLARTHQRGLDGDKRKRVGAAAASTIAAYCPDAAPWWN